MGGEDNLRALSSLLFLRKLNVVYATGRSSGLAAADHLPIRLGGQWSLISRGSSRFEVRGFERTAFPFGFCASYLFNLLTCQLQS
jgi:hypothetical protein